MRGVAAALLLVLVELATGGVARAQEPAPTATPEPVASPSPEPTPYDYRAGMPGVYPGPRPVRGAFQAGLHAFAGEGWNGSGEPETNDYVGGAGIISAIWDWTPILAGVGTFGFSSGEDRPSGPVEKVTFSVAHVSAGLRLQTPAAKRGLYVQAGLGGFRGARQIVPPFPAPVTEENTTGVTAHVAGGGTLHVTQGVDAFAEIRGSTAPGGFDDDALDLGGVTTSVGFSLRL